MVLFSTQPLTLIRARNNSLCIGLLRLGLNWLPLSNFDCLEISEIEVLEVEGSNLKETNLINW